MAKSGLRIYLVALAGICSGAAAEAQHLEHITRSRVIEWQEPDRQETRTLTFAPLTFDPSPPLRWERRPDHRWWATAVVEAVVAAGLIASDRVAPATDAAESFMRRMELSFDVPVVAHQPDDRWRLQFRLKVKRARPNAGFVLSW